VLIYSMRDNQIFTRSFWGGLLRGSRGFSEKKLASSDCENVKIDNWKYTKMQCLFFSD
jgi:hypothetical protein